MTEQIDQTKVDELHQYFLDGGSDGENDVKKQLGEDCDAIAYVQALKEKYPNAPYMEKKKRGRPAATSTASVSSSSETQKETEPTTVLLLDPDTGIAEELEITSIKGTKIYAQRKVPTEIVTLKIRGKDVDVDLIRLRKMKATEQLHGVPVNQLIMLADIAKGV